MLLIETLLVMGMALGAEPALVGATASQTAVAHAPVDVVEHLKGVYKVRFRNGDVSGDEYMSENILEIAPYKAGSAYFRVHLEFYNGHMCALYGIARALGDRLTYSVSTGEPARVCRVEIAHVDGKVTLRDTAPGLPCKAFCGARGSMQAEWPYAARRRIKYMKALLNSREHLEAVAAFEDAPAAPSATSR